MEDVPGGANGEDYLDLEIDDEQRRMVIRTLRTIMVARMVYPGAGVRIVRSSEAEPLQDMLPEEPPASE